MRFSQYLNSCFENVETIYFDSYLSKHDEDSNLINIANVNNKLRLNEFDVANDASLHSQVLFIASKAYSKYSYSLRKLSSEKILTLNSIPNVSLLEFPNDAALLEHCHSANTNTFLITSKLMQSSIGHQLINSFTSAGLNFFQLDMETPLSSLSSSVSILGLEKEWTSDIAYDRLCVNRIREVPDVKLEFLIVDSREDKQCHPSLIAMDC